MDIVGSDGFEADEANEYESKPVSSRSISLQPMSEPEMKIFEADLNNRGVVYLSRIPPYMQPQKIRHLLGQYGEVIRIYLAPEG